MTRPEAVTRRAMLGASAALAAMALAGCSSLPADGPRTSAVEAGAEPRDGTPPPYVLVELTETTAKAVSAAETQATQDDAARSALPRAAAVGLIGAGDLLKVTLWEPSLTGATLLAAPGLDLSVRVGADGAITVPYVGRVHAAGRSPAQVEATLRATLAASGHEMQTAVLVIEDNTNVAVVQGDVTKPGRYPVLQGARGLLDLIALAGGARTPDHSATVRVTRGDASTTASLSRIVADPSLDMQLSPGDRVMVLPRARYFYAFGAVSRPGEQPYDADSMTMARMLGRVAGLADNRADPGGVFVYRRQSAQMTRQIAGTALRPDQDPTQVVYRVDLRSPAGFFVADTFRIKPDDIVYVTSAPLAEASKALQIILGLSGIAAVPHNFGAPS
jgi:polysaccharide export outer membrane protein